MSSDALVVMAKRAEPGNVKTRLVPPLTDREAATLHTLFIADTVKNLSFLEDVKCFLALTRDAESENTQEEPVHKDVENLNQVGLDLGERMLNVFRALFSGAFKRVIVIGSDSPDIPIEYIKEAFLKLSEDSSKVVLGPADDGGYYLIAMSHLDERPFSNIKWGSDSVLAETVESLAGDAVLLKPWYDIDRPIDILKLVDTGRAGESINYIMEEGILKKCKDFL